jgi:hypothetical protein
MSAPSRRLLTCGLAGLLGLAAITLPACGGESRHGLLRRSEAAELRATLDRIQQTVSSGDCSTAQTDTTTLAEQVDGLPRRVDHDLRVSLAAGARRLSALVARQCAPEAAQTPTGPTTTPPPEKGRKKGNEGTTGPPGQQKKKNKEEQQGPDESFSSPGQGQQGEGGGGTTGSGGANP